MLHELEREVGISFGVVCQLENTFSTAVETWEHIIVEVFPRLFKLTLGQVAQIVISFTD